MRGRAKTGYYKVAILLEAAVVEALAHHILKIKIQGGASIPNGPWECYECYTLPQIYQQGVDKLAICKRRILVFRLTNKTDFAKVNKICKDLNIFSNSFFKKIERIRTMRNRIHLQGLDQIDRSYTMKQVDSVGYVINKLIDKLP